MPKIDLLSHGREIFAIWTPYGARDAKEDSFLIDSNGLELLSKKVIPYDSWPVGRYLYPVNSMIAFKEGGKTSSFIVWNDRP